MRTSLKAFDSYVTEAKKASSGEIPWEASPALGWWKNGSHVTVYHGTHIKHLEQIKKGGLNRVDPTTGQISVALEPNTAHGYAAMSAAGGEAHFRAVGGRPKHTPENERVVVKYKIPRQWLNDNMDHKLGGNIGISKHRMEDRVHYDHWNQTHKGENDQGYYALSELRLKKYVPPEFMVGHMRKKK
jgi:hypothetical protein